MRLRPLTEAECYARCYGGRREEVPVGFRDAHLVRPLFNKLGIEKGKKVVPIREVADKSAVGKTNKR